MPIIWRYILNNFIFIFLLSSTSLVALLLVSRFKEIAKFATLASDSFQIFTFIFCQIPLILPLIIPICSLLSGYILAQNLSKGHLITTLRASAINLKSILFPILVASILLGRINFTITGTVSSKCKRLTRQLIHTESSTNPLSLLQKMTLSKMKKHFIQISPSKNSEDKNALIIFKNENLNRTSLISIENLKASNNLLSGDNFSSISFIPEKTNLFDSLILENQRFIEIDAKDFLQKITKKKLKFDNDSLEISILRLKSKEPSKKAGKIMAEIFSRISLGFSCITFAILGFVFGVQNSRVTSKKTLLYLLINTSFFIACYLIGKSLKKPINAASILFLPHLYLLLTSIKRIRNIDQGKL